MYLAGIDVGTTTTKAVILDVETGQIRAIGSARTITRHPRVEWSEFDADELWATVVESLRSALAQCDHPELVQAISVASMGEAGFPLDADGNVLYPAIAWYDQRTAPQAQWWDETFGRERIFELTGHTTQPIFGINKLLWLRENRPEVFGRIARWLSVEDFVLWKLSGNFATDYSIASRTMVFEQRTLSWSHSLLQHAAIPEAWFPPASPGGTAIGKISTQAAAETGLPAHTIVTTGGHDHLCGAFAVGILQPGQLFESTGTAAALFALSNTFQPSEEMLSVGCTSYAYVVPETYIVLGYLSLAGGSLEWIVNLLYGEQGIASPAAYTQAMQASAQVSPGARGALILPYFLGSGTPHSRHAAQAAILGLNPSHGRPELVRAVMEGLGFWLRDNLEMLYSLKITPAHPEITAVGGGSTHAHELVQIKADITGCSIRVPDVPEAAATGAALLAGTGAGVFSSANEAVTAVKRTETLYEPREAIKSLYDEIYQGNYKTMRDAVLHVSK